jgi:hypothetical protein
MLPSEPPKDGLNAEPSEPEIKDECDGKPNANITITTPPNAQKHSAYCCKATEKAYQYFDNIKCFLRDPSRVLAFLTACLVLVGIGALCLQRDTETRQLRAYISVTTATLLVIAVGDANWVKVHLVTKNFGQTPAYDYADWACYAVRPLSDEIKFGGPKEKLLRPQFGMKKLPTSIIGPSDVRHKNFAGDCDRVKTPDDKPIALTTLQIDDINAGASIIYLYGESTYKDAFGFSRYTRYRMFGARDAGLSEGKTVDAVEGNDAN